LWRGSRGQSWGKIKRCREGVRYLHKVSGLCIKQFQIVSLSNTFLPQLISLSASPSLAQAELALACMLAYDVFVTELGRTQAWAGRFSSCPHPQPYPQPHPPHLHPHQPAATSTGILGSRAHSSAHSYPAHTPVQQRQMTKTSSCPHTHLCIGQPIHSQATTCAPVHEAQKVWGAELDFHHALRLQHPPPASAE